tara:strand:- start:1624 stop:1776 length:153 start_codon:yes stop_codon:yes gene_type:complete
MIVLRKELRLKEILNNLKEKNGYSSSIARLKTITTTKRMQRKNIGSSIGC